MNPPAWHGSVLRFRPRHSHHPRAESRQLSVGSGASGSVPKGTLTVVNLEPLHEIPPYLRDLVGKHAVVYRVTADGEVLIVRVLHAAMLPSEFVLHLETPWGFVTQDEVR